MGYGVFRGVLNENLLLCEAKRDYEAAFARHFAFLLFGAAKYHLTQLTSRQTSATVFRKRSTKPSSQEMGPGRKPGPYEWYAIQDTSDFFEHFHVPKIIWPDIAKMPRFVLETTGAFLDATCCFVPADDPFLLGILASWATWFLISKSCQPLRLRGDRWQYRLKKQWMAQLPVPDAPHSARTRIGDLALNCNAWGQTRHDLQEEVRRRMIQGFGEGREGSSLGKLNQEAEKWWDLSVNQLGSALRKSFKLSQNLFGYPKVAEAWEEYLREKKTEIGSLSRVFPEGPFFVCNRVK